MSLPYKKKDAIRFCVWLVIPCLPCFSGCGMISLLVWGYLLRSFPLLSLSSLLMTRGDTSGNEVSPCMRYIVLPPAVLTPLLEFWVSAWLTLIRPSASGASPNLAIDQKNIRIN